MRRTTQLIALLVALSAPSVTLAITVGQRAFDANGRAYDLVVLEEPEPSTILRAAEVARGDELARWTLSGRGRFVAVDSQGRLACVLGLRGAAAKRNFGEAPATPRVQDWVFWTVDLVAGQVSAATPLGMQPSGMALYDGPGGPRLLVAGRDKVATWTIHPTAPSWFYTSPGNNTDLCISAGPSATEAIVAVLRDGMLVIIDPARRPRENGRVQLTGDDATASVPLPDYGISVGINPEGTLVAVLHQDRNGMTWVDVRDSKVLETDLLPEPRLQVGRVTRSAPAAPAADAAAVPPAIAEKPPAIAEKSPPAPQPSAQAPAEPPAPTVMQKPTPAQTTPPKATPDPAPAPPPQVPPARPESAPAAAGSQPKAEPASAGSQSPAPPAAAGTISGKITGSVPGGVEVLLYGPNNILKLHARIGAKPDGTFQGPLPPPGSYRVVVRPKNSVQLFTSPEMRTLVVEAGSGGLNGIDFEVRGAFK